MDIFVVAHLVGWYMKGLILRDYWLCWIISVLFEVMEYSLQHQLPNFAECWWDHWILDVALCNALGIYLGLKTCEYLNIKTFNWIAISSIPTYKGKLKRTLLQLTPHSWSSYEWTPSKSPKHYLCVVLVVFTVLQFEVNHFYLKYLFWVPAEHVLNPCRLVMFALTAAPAVREFHNYLFSPVANRMGPHSLLLFANIWTETVTCVKFGQGEFPNPAPLAVKVFWLLFVSFLCAYPVVRFGLCRKTKSE